MQDIISELQIQRRIATTIQNDTLCILSLVTSKLQVVCWRSTYQTTPLLSEMYIPLLELDARYEWRLMPPNMHCRLFWQAICAYTVVLNKHNLKTSDHMWTRAATNIRFVRISWHTNSIRILIYYPDHSTKVGTNKMFTFLLRWMIIQRYRHLRSISITQ